MLLECLVNLEKKAALPAFAKTIVQAYIHVFFKLPAVANAIIGKNALYI